MERAVPGRTSRALTRLAAGVAAAITLLPPIGIFAVQREGVNRSLAAEVRVQSALISTVAGRNPAVWHLAHDRLIEAIEPARSPDHRTRVLDSNGKVITAAGAVPRAPTLSVDEVFFDSGLPAGRVEVSASLSGALTDALWVLAVSSVFGFLVFVPLRRMPARALKRASESLVRAGLSQSLVDGLSTGVVLTDERLWILATNRSAAAVPGIGAPLVRGADLEVCFGPATREDGTAMRPEDWPMRRCLESLQPEGPVVVGLRDGGNEEVWLSLRSTPVSHGENGEHVAVVTAIEDISAAKRNADRLVITERAVMSSQGAIVIANAHWRMILVNDAFCTMTGYESDEVIGQPVAMLRAGLHNDAQYETLQRQLKETGAWSGDVWVRHHDGRAFPAWLSASEVRDANGRLTHFIVTLFDLTERIEAEERVRHLALHDPLTGLPNRASLRETLGQALATSDRRSCRVGIFFIDLDRFKLINDTLGHQAGDAVLRDVARRLKSVLRAEDTVGRLAGDEFVAFTPLVSSESGLVTIAENMLQAMSEPFPVGGEEVFLSSSIGIAVAPDDGEDVDTLLSKADTAMYAAKADGRANWKFFTDAMNEAGQNQLQTVREVRAALDRREFVLHYQPQLLASDGRTVVGAEALIRWRHPERGLVLPGRFIPHIEGTRLIIEVGQWVLEEALRQSAEWNRRGTPVCISVNVSPLQFQQDDYVDALRAAAARGGFVAGSVRLEITENLMISDPAATIRKMNEIRTLGFRLSLDDFGTGYSSLSYLSRFPFDELKIDRSFVARLGEDAVAEAIVDAIITLSHALDLDTVAEGVETEAQAQALRRLGCTQLQGFLYGRPVPPDEFDRWLRTDTPALPHEECA